MTDQEIGFVPAGKEVQIVESVENIPLDENTMLFNPGHSAAMGQSLKRIIDNEFTNIYQVKSKPNQFLVSIDVDGFSDSKYMTDPRMLDELLSAEYQQLRLNASLPLGYLQMTEQFPQNAGMYREILDTSLEVLNRNVRIADKLVGRTEDRGLATVQNTKFIDNIKETIILAGSLSNSRK